MPFILGDPSKTFAFASGALLLSGCFVHCGKVDLPPAPRNAPDEFRAVDEQRAREERAFDDGWHRQTEGTRGGSGSAPGGATLPVVAAGAAGGLVVGVGVAAVVGADRDASTGPVPADERAR